MIGWVINDLALTVDLVRGMRCEELHATRPYSQLLQGPNPSRPSNILEGSSCATTVRNPLWLPNRHTYFNSSRYIMHAGQSLDGTVNNDEDPRGVFSLGVDVMSVLRYSHSLLTNDPKSIGRV